MTEKHKREKKQREREKDGDLCGVGTIEIVGGLWWPTAEHVSALGWT